MFEVRGVYANRKGKYTVLNITPPKMTVRYEDGSEADLNIRLQNRIWENIVVEQEAADAKVASRRSRTARNIKHYIKAINIPDIDELMFPGWQENVILATVNDMKQVHVGHRIIYYAIEPRVFFAVATITGDASEADPKDYFYKVDSKKASFFPVDMDAFASQLDHGISSDGIELESYPNFKTMKIRSEAFLEISEDDFELVAELLAEISEDEIDEVDEEDFEEEEDD